MTRAMLVPGRLSSLAIVTLSLALSGCLGGGGIDRPAPIAPSDPGSSNNSGGSNGVGGSSGGAVDAAGDPPVVYVADTTPLSNALYGLYRAQDLTQDDGGAVSYWPNTSAAATKGANLTQDGTATPPAFKLNASGTYAAVVFGTASTPSTRMTLGPNYNVSNNLAYVWVLANRIQGFGGITPIFRGNYSAVEIGFGLYIDFPSETNNSLSIFSHNGSARRDSVPSPTGAQIISLNITNGPTSRSVTLRDNGVELANLPTQAVDYGRDGASPTLVGMYGAESNVDFSLMEMRAYSRALTADELNALEDSLGAAYGITVLHPVNGSNRGSASN